MVAHRWIADTRTGEFLVGGPEPFEPTPVAGGTVVSDTHILPAGLVRLVLTRPPDQRRERYSGNPGSPFMAASPAQIAATDAAVKDAEATRQLDGSKLLLAITISALWGRLGHQPTPAEIAAERARILLVYKSLPA